MPINFLFPNLLASSERPLQYMKPRNNNSKCALNILPHCLLSAGKDSV